MTGNILFSGFLHILRNGFYGGKGILTHRLSEK